VDRDRTLLGTTARKTIVSGDCLVRGAAPRQSASHVEPQTALARARVGLVLVNEDGRRSIMGTSGLVGSCASRHADCQSQAHR